MPRFVMFDELFETFGEPVGETSPEGECGQGDGDDPCFDCGSDCVDFDVEMRILDAVVGVAVDVDELVSGYVRLSAAVFGETVH